MSAGPSAAGIGHTAVQALRGVSFTVDRGQLVALRGRSGSGKTTLLNIIGGLDDPTAGRVWVDGREVNRMTERERLSLRRDTVAFIFQSFGLVPMLSAAENVGIPLRIEGLRPSERRERVAAMLALTGMASHAAHRPGELSGGQQQRVGIARALAGRPGLLIADEPTSQLDLETGRQIMQLLLSVVHSEGITALVATHDEALDLLPISGISAQSYTLRSGLGSIQISSDSYGPAVVDPAAFGGALAVSQGSWMVLPQAPAMARGNLEALNAGTSAAVSQLAVLLPDGLAVTSSLPQLLAGIATTVVLTRSLFAIAALLLLLVAWAGLVLAARLLASLREEESALLRARGATRWQVVRPVLAEAAVLGAAAGVAGVLAGTGLTGALARLADLRLAGYTGRGITSLAWLSALAVLVVCVAVMTWPALHTLTPDAARLRRGRQARLAGIAWAGGDLALLALAAVAVWELRGYSASRIRPRARSGSIPWSPWPPRSRWPGWRSSRCAGCRCWPGWPTGRPTTNGGWPPRW
jgi:putative ABC transport system ATP-binding protein